MATSSEFGGDVESTEQNNLSEDVNVLYSLYVALAMAYIFYYLFYVVKKPVICCNSKYSEFLEKHCPILSENFWPTIWCVESRLQTILRVFLQSRPCVPYEKEILQLADGGQVALDWVYNDSDSQYTPTKPIVLILPGLVGSSQESYALHLVSESTKLGFRCVVFNNRGNGGAELKTARTYNATNTEDLSSVISHVVTRFPSSPVVAIGISLGGIILTNYLAKTGADCGLVAGMTCSSPWNVFESSKSLQEPINLVCFNRFLCKSLKQAIIKNEHLFRDKCDLRAVYDSVTIRDFDETFTAKMFGYKSVEDYYQDACIHEKVHSIKVPLLCLNSADDPFSPGQFIPTEEARKSENVMIIVTSRGGHIGFVDGCLKPNSVGYMQRLFCQYAKAICDHGDELIGCGN